MLILLTRQYVKNKIETGPIILNTDFMSDLVVSGTGARFRFFRKGENRRGGEDIYIVEESVATILTAMNTAYFATGITLAVYPDNDATKTPVDTVFNVAEIERAYPNSPGDHTKSWVEINWKGTRVYKYLINGWFATLEDHAITGTTTTTSTTTTA